MLKALSQVTHSVLALVLLVVPNFASAESSASVWSVTKGGQTLYIGGTLHLLKREDYPLPEPFGQAYQRADTLVFETDIAAVNSPQVQDRLSAMLMLPPDQTLSKMVSTGTYSELDTYLRGSGLSIAQFQNMKPAMVALVITVLELKKLGLGEAGVDQFYHTKGLQDGKKIGWVESVDAHLRYIATMGEGEEDTFLKYSLLDLENLEAGMSEMSSMWRKGDMEGLDKAMIQPMLSEFPKVYNSLIVERNENWLPQIEAMVKTPEVEFILVGAGHLAGKDGVLKKLSAKGYAIEKLVAP